ncbi:MAG TPA: aminoglycoside 6-adenylyltransferase [Chitinophagaceae bacterium]|nr:aminoglycoside 6-adenylyltransferase [Chitinophagaceae bacterium]
MRSELEIIQLILDVAAKDDRVRAILLNGSRTNRGIAPDKYQDYDITFIVNDMATFTVDHSWLKVFGEMLLCQLPNEMTVGNADPGVFAYLMILEDGNRIDLTLYPQDKVVKNSWPDSLTVCLLDKDNQFNSLPPPGDSGYLIKKPSSKEFADVCNEFWWVSTYVAKGLLRNEITYAKEMMETVVRPMFMKIIEWKIGVNKGFSVSFGTAGRFIKKYVPDNYYQRILQTYSDADIENTWQALFNMMDLFTQTSNEVAQELDFPIDKKEQENASRWLRQQYAERKQLPH